MKVYWWQTVLLHPTRKYLYFTLILISIYSRYKILYCQSLSCSNYRCYFLGFSLSLLYLEDNGYLIIVCFWNLFASALISSDFSIFSCFFPSFFTVLLSSHIFNFYFFCWSLWESDFCCLLFPPVVTSDALFLWMFCDFCLYNSFFTTVELCWGLGRKWILLEVICFCSYWASILSTLQL